MHTHKQGTQTHNTNVIKLDNSKNTGLQKEYI